MTTNTAERARRIGDLWSRRPSMTESEVAAEVDAELAAEAAERAQADARAREMSESMTAMSYTCAVCGQTREPNARDALCGHCRPVVAQVRAERAAAEQVGDSTRRQLAAQYVDSRG